ncbi:MAG: lactate utilization protein [Christensenellales bacterium]
MTPKQQYYENIAATLIKNLARRQMEGFYCPDKESAVKKALELMPEGASVAWGGSMTLAETGLLSAVKAGPYQVIDRDSAKTPEERRALYGQICCADFFLMSTNAITLEGELVNVDGTANRVAFLCFGPQEVIILAGMNKLVKDVAAGYDRARNMAAPPNTLRLNRKTPCAATGRCGDCQSPESICCQTVITRRSSVPGRIKVILIGEELGF